MRRSYPTGTYLLGPGPGVLAHRRDVSLSCAPPMRSATWGAKKRRHEGSARAPSEERFSRSETRRAVRLCLAELSERTLRGRLPVLRCRPFALSESPAFLEATGRCYTRLPSA